VSSEDREPASGHTFPAGEPDQSLRVHPSVIFKLGEDLITDEIQALVELIKNSYDADSTWVRLRIQTDEAAFGVDGYGDQLDEPAIGTLTLEDGGTGMTRDQIISGWLTVSNSWKRAFKLTHQTTALGRTPLGDKGLGRLGAQRLGDYLEIETRPANSPDAWAVSIPWRAYENAPSLDSVKIRVRPISRGDQRQGTKITIRGLSPRFVELAKPESLILELSKMVSPFEGNKDFDLRVALNDESLDLRSLSGKIRSAAEVHYALNYADGLLQVKLTMDYRILKSNQPEQAGQFFQWIEPDRGAAFSKWLMAEKSSKVQSFGLTLEKPDSLVTGTYDVNVFDHAELAMSDGSFADPGPFRAEIEAVDLDEDRANAFDTRTKYAQYVREIGGIRIYRDGFAVRTDPDWLGLNKRWSTGRSYYGLKPNTVLGFVNITASDNSGLTETTNREGFQKTPALANFNRIMGLWLDYTDRFQEFVRRSYLEYIAEVASISTPVPTALPPAQAAERIASVLLRSSEIKTQVTDVSRAVSEILTGSTASGGTQALPFLTDAEVGRILDRLEALVSQVDSFSVELTTAQRDVDVVRQSIETTRNQLADVWQTVAVGLSAESVAHEIRNVLDVLRGRTQAARKRVRSSANQDSSWNVFLEYVDSSIKALRLQLGHIEPGLRYARDRKDEFVVGEFLAEQIDFYTKNSGVDANVSFSLNVRQDFSVRANKGRLAQAVDNLFLNSIYWIGELNRRIPYAGEVSVHVDAPFVVIVDNGPGIAPAIEESLFEPFVTLKPSGQGRGLGLYVVSQLLDTDGGKISLGPARGPDGRYRSFEMDLSAAISGGAAIERDS
jgi:signal transduction histidine kinase